MNIDPVNVHRLKNQLAIIMGFSELLLEELPADDPHRPDVLQIHQAAKTALGVAAAAPGARIQFPPTAFTGGKGWQVTERLAAPCSWSMMSLACGRWLDAFSKAAAIT